MSLKRKLAISFAIAGVGLALALAFLVGPLRDDSVQDADSETVAKPGSARGAVREPGGSAGDDVADAGRIRAVKREALPAVPAEQAVSIPEQASREPVPEGIPTGFFSLSEREQVGVVNAHLRESMVRRPLLEFFRKSLVDKRLGALIRNNMALVLRKHDALDTEAGRQFIRCIEDPDEEPKWRMYAIQLLADTYPWSDEPEAVVSKLEEVFTSYEEPYAAQGMVMLAELERAGYREFKGLDDQIAQRLEQDSGTPATRASALALLGTRKAREHVDLVRQFAATDAPERRVAIASLGAIGDASDLAMLRAVASADQAGLIGLVARKSIEKIEARQK